MGIAELKGGSRWAPGVGFTPDCTAQRAHVGASHSKNIAAQTAYAIAALSPLLISIALLIALLGAILVFSDTAVAGFGERFRVADFFVPPGFFLILLTSRRYGAGRALLQLLGALSLCGAAMLAGFPLLRALVSDLPQPHAAGAFLLAFALANGAAIALFEAARGPSWWKAPALSAMAAALVFSAIFYPLTNESWAIPAALHVAQQSAEAVLLLIPYWLLRGAIRPLPGLNGY